MFRPAAFLAAPGFASLAASLAAFLLAFAPPARGAVPRLDTQDAVSASQAAIGKRIGDDILLDRQSRPVSLASYRGKPLLVSFIYTGCFEVCPTSTRTLDEAVGALQSRLGEGRFNVVSIGFNQPADSPEAMRAFAAQHRIARANWEFLSPPAALVDKLTSEFGFRYQATPAGFDHVVQVTLVDAQGRIARQVYGESIVEELRPSLERMIAGAPPPPPALLEGLAERVRLLCTVYDPKTGTYRVDYSIAWEIAGGVTFIVAMVAFGIGEWRGRRRGGARDAVRSGA